jgi:hypothetical protein
MPSSTSADTPPLSDQGDHDRDTPGQHRTDDRDERTEEHQRGQRHRERDTEDDQTDADPDGVDNRHRGGSPDVGDQRGQAAAPRHIDPAAHRRGRRPEQELPDSGAAVQEEDQREQHQQHLGDRLLR